MCRHIEMIGSIGVTITTIINSDAKQNHNAFSELNLIAAASRITWSRRVFLPLGGST